MINSSGKKVTEELRTLSSDLVNRMQFFRQAGVTFEGLRSVWDVLGYPQVITPSQYLTLYTRGGLAGACIDALPKATWRGNMTLTDDDNPEKESEFEKQWKITAKRVRLNTKLEQVDILSQIGQYAVLLIGAPGNFNEELPKGKPEQLAYLTPFLGAGGPGSFNGFGDVGARVGSGSQQMNLTVAATIQELDSDAHSERFGMPLFYSIRRTDVTTPELGKSVHWTRVIHVADRLLDNEVYGAPALERVWNLFEDLLKVAGGGSEAFWLRASQGTVLNIDSDANMDPKELAAMDEKVEQFQHQLRRFMVLRKAQLQEMGSDVADFSGSQDSIITQIAGSMRIPKRILTGSEQGELASSQDRDNWRDQVIGRQESHAGPNIARALADRLIKYGYQTAPSNNDYNVKWPTIQILTDEEKTTGAKSWAEVNKTMGEVVFTNPEIRKHWQGFAPLEPKDIKPVGAPAPEVAPKEEKPMPKPRLVAAEQHTDITRMLEDAIRDNNTNALNYILGTEFSAQ